MPVNNALTPEGQNALGAAFGYYPHLRRYRTVQDPQAALDMPVQFLRGRVAGTLGMPSDIANLVRSPMPTEMFGEVDYGQQTQVPYGTQDLLKRLPLAPQGPAQQAAANVGSVVPISPAEALQAARLARQAALAGGRVMGEEMAARMLSGQSTIPGLPASVAPSPVKFVFVGENSKTWNKGNAAKAVEMEKAGAKPEDIWMATGTFRGPEGKLRQEVSDTGAKLTLGQNKPDAYGAIEAKTFEGALNHPRLQQAYPELNEIKFQHWPNEDYLGANFDPADNVVTMGKVAMKPEKGVALHELQHAIQRKEGFAKGGSPSTVLNDWYEGVNSELSSLVKQMDSLPDFERKFNKTKQAQYDALRSRYDELINQKLYSPPDQTDMYNRLAGEAEARAVQKRMNMTDTQRRVIFPYESYDVPINQLIVRTK